MDLALRKADDVILGDQIEGEYIQSFCLSWQGHDRAILGLPITRFAASKQPVKKPARAGTQAMVRQVFRGRRLVVIPSRPDVCELRDLRIGNKTQVMNHKDGIPVQMFSLLAFHCMLNMDTALADDLVEIDFQNRSRFDDVTIRCGLLGHVE